MPISKTEFRKLMSIFRVPQLNSLGTGLQGSNGSALPGGAAAYTWATKPAASSVAEGTKIVITDYGVPTIEMVSDGTNWYPVGGSQLLYSAVFGSLATPTLSVSGAAANFNVGTDPVIPAGMLTFGVAGAPIGLRVKARYARSGALTTTITNRIYLGTSATPASNSLLFTANYAATDTSQLQVSTKFWAETATSGTRTGFMTEGGAAAASSYSTLNTLINTAAAMNVSFGISAYSGGTLTDVISLLKYEIYLEV